MIKSLFFAAVLAAAAVAPAQAVTLNFAGLNGDGQELILEYYNGGSGGSGSTGGPNYGISFSNNAIACSVQPDGSCNSAGLPDGGNLLFFLSGAASTMNVAGGFDTALSFYYSAVNNPAFLSVYDGLNGTGNLLATLSLPTTPSTPADPACFGTGFCPYVPISVSFTGTAYSVDFGGAADQVAFASITLGAASVPEPAAWALMIGGFGMVGATMRRRRTAGPAFNLA